MRIPIPAWHYGYTAPAAPGDPPVPELGAVVPPGSPRHVFRWGLEYYAVMQVWPFTVANYLNDATMDVELTVTGAGSTWFILNGSFTSSTGHVPGSTYLTVPDTIRATISANSNMYITYYFQYNAVAPLPSTFPSFGSAGVHGAWSCKDITAVYHADILYQYRP